MLKVYDDSKNYTAQVVVLRTVQKLGGLDNLVGASYFGNLALISKEYPLDQKYVFVPSGTVLSHDFIKRNNLFREPTLNDDLTKKGFFEPNCRVKAIKFKGHKSTGFLFPLEWLQSIEINPSSLEEGNEFNSVNGIHVCRKYKLPVKGSASQAKKVKLLDEIIDSRFMPEHPSTDMLLKYLDRIDLDDDITISIKLHGTSLRTGYTLTKRKLSVLEQIAKFFGCQILEEQYRVAVGSHHVVKSIDFETLSGKQHFYSEDLWSKVSEEFFRSKLLKGELVYSEIIGKEYSGKEIQKDYSYGLNNRDVYVYRISKIGPDGVEVDLSYKQMKARCNELGVKFVPEIYSGKLRHYLEKHNLSTNENWRNELEKHLQETYLDKPSILDKNIIEEGICLRKESYPRPKIFKLKSPLFYIHEGVMIDRGIEDIEEQS